MRKLFSLLVVLLLVCSLAGCGEKESETIKIGSSGPLSGSASIYGQAVKEGVELAIEEINAAGGVNGTKLELTATGGVYTFEVAAGSKVEIKTSDASHSYIKGLDIAF